MTIRSLFKFSMNWAYYFYFGISIYIISLTIIIFIIMNYICFINKLFCCFSFQFISFLYSTFSTPTSRQMTRSSLFKISMYRTGYNYFFIRLNIYCFRIIILISMNFSGFFYKIISCLSFSLFYFSFTFRTSSTIV